MESSSITPTALLAAAQADHREAARLANQIQRFLRRNSGVIHAEVGRDEVTGTIKALAWVAPTPVGLPQRQLPDGTVLSELNGYETEYLYQEIFVEKAYLPAGLRLPPDALVLDIGANIGMFSLFVSRLVPAGRVVAFEPGPDAYAALTANVEKLGLPVSTLPWAIGGRSGRATMTVYPGASVFSGLRADPTTDRPAIQAAVAAALENASAGEIDIEKVVADVASRRVEGGISFDVDVRSLT